MYNYTVYISIYIHIERDKVSSSISVAAFVYWSCYWGHKKQVARYMV